MGLCRALLTAGGHSKYTVSVAQAPSKAILKTLDCRQPAPERLLWAYVIGMSQAPSAVSLKNRRIDLAS